MLAMLIGLIAGLVLIIVWIAATVYNILKITGSEAIKWEYDEEDPIDGYVDYYSAFNWFDANFDNEYEYSDE